MVHNLAISSETTLSFDNVMKDTVGTMVVCNTTHDQTQTKINETLPVDKKGDHLIISNKSWNT